MGLLDVGYHYAIERGGEVVRCRPPESIGSHCLGYNHNSVAVCLIGGSDSEGHPEDNFTLDQRISFLQLARILDQLFAVPGEHLQLLGHTELNRYRGRHRSRPCPALDMEKLREDLAKFRSTGDLYQ